MKRIYWIVIGTAVLFGAVYAAFGLGSPLIWNSPDETSVAFFSHLFADSGRLWAFDPYNVFTNNLIHPRSIISVDAQLVPGSFYGAMWFFGFLFKGIDTSAFAIGTPLMTALASVCVFFLVRRFYTSSPARLPPLLQEERQGLELVERVGVRCSGEVVAYVAMLLFLTHPAVWYYASRGLFPNLLFIDLVLLGVAILHLRPWKHIAKSRGNVLLERCIDDVVGMLFLALAFAVRPVEFVWLTPLLIVWWIAVRKQMSVVRVVLGVLVTGFMLSGLLLTNNTLYGGALNFGYTTGVLTPGVAVPSLDVGSTLPAFISSPRPYVLPFGFHPRAALTNVWTYTIVFVPWYAVPALVGLFFFPLRPAKRLIIATIFVGGVLGIYYGSGMLGDSTVPGTTIGSSYLRYFLPFSLLMVPFAAEGLSRLALWIGRRYAPIVLTILTLLIGLLGFWTVYYRTPESLVTVRGTLTRYAEIKKEVLTRTTERDVIIVERSDKLFFPDRRVMLDLRNPVTLDILPKLALVSDVYYYGISINDDEYPHIQGELKKRNLAMGRVAVFGNEALYSITPVQ